MGIAAPNIPSIAIDQPVKIRVVESKVYLFDAETGDRIRFN